MDSNFTIHFGYYLPILFSWTKWSLKHSQFSIVLPDDCVGRRKLDCHHPPRAHAAIPPYHMTTRATTPSSSNHPSEKRAKKQMTERNHLKVFTVSRGKILMSSVNLTVSSTCTVIVLPINLLLQHARPIHRNVRDLQCDDAAQPSRACVVRAMAQRSECAVAGDSPTWQAYGYGYHMHTAATCRACDSVAHVLLINSCKYDRNYSVYIQ